MRGFKLLKDKKTRMSLLRGIFDFKSLSKGKGHSYFGAWRFSNVSAIFNRRVRIGIQNSDDMLRNFFFGTLPGYKKNNPIGISVG